MNIKKILLLTLFFFSISFLTPMISTAVDSPKAKVSNDSFVTRIVERIEYFFAFRIEKKVEVLEKQAEIRLNMAHDYADNGDQTEVQNSLQSYLQTKEKQDNLLGKVNDEGVLEVVQERTIDQQKTMENIKTKVGEDVQQTVIQVQEQVVNQVAQRVIDINGKEGQTEFFNKVEHVWAPGTGPGGEAGVIYQGGAGQQYAPGTSAGEGGGVVYEGGAKIMFAPGTSGGENGGVDIKTVEVKSD